MESERSWRKTFDIWLYSTEANNLISLILEKVLCRNIRIVCALFSKTRSWYMMDVSRNGNTYRVPGRAGTGPANRYRSGRTGTGPVEKVNRAGRDRNFTGWKFKKIFFVNPDFGHKNQDITYFSVRVRKKVLKPHVILVICSDVLFKTLIMLSVSYMCY